MLWNEHFRSVLEVLILKDLQQILSDADLRCGKPRTWLRPDEAVEVKSRGMVAEDYWGSIVISAKTSKIQFERTFGEVEQRDQASANISSLTERNEKSKPAPSKAKGMAP